MDPITTAVLSTLSKAVFGGAAGKAKEFLDRKGLSKRVARATVKSCKKHGIRISRKSIRRWLERDDVKNQISQGSATEVESALLSLAVAIEGQPAEKRLECAKEVLHLILQEYQRELPAKDAISLGTVWTQRTTAQENSKTQALVLAGTQHILDKIDVPESFDRAVAQLHPWRQEPARRIAESWPPFREFVESLVYEKDRGQVLADWSTRPPQKFTDAPSAAWCWFGSVAEDYKAKKAAIFFYKQGVNQGATNPGYWEAKAIMLVDAAVPEGLLDLQEFVKRSDASHAMTKAFLAIAEKRFSDSQAALSTWDPADDADTALKTSLQAACLEGLDDINGAISVLENAFDRDSSASGLALAASRALIWRGQHGRGDENIADLVRAGELAIAARNARRTWGGDSVEAILEAVKASVLSNDLDQAWRLTQCAPLGEASFRESKNKRICIESAFVAASKNDYTLAQTVASELDDPFVIAYINGWVAFRQDDRENAAMEWRKAWDEGTNDFDHLRSANALALLGVEIPDLNELSTLYPDAVRDIRDIHRTMSASGDKIALLRAKVGKSESFAGLLAEQLAGRGEHEEAGQVLEEAANRWSSSRLMSMAASSYLRAGENASAERTAGEAVNMAVRGSTGEEYALMLRFDALEALERHEESLRLARRMVANNPQNENTRWILVHLHARMGNYQAAWDVLNHDGAPIGPRSNHDATLWIHLASKHDTRPSFVSHSLRIMHEQSDDAELLGIFLANTLLAAGNASKTDIKTLQGKMHTYTSENPDSVTFRALKFESAQQFLEDLKEHFKGIPEDPERRAIEKSICEGKLPLGLLSEISGKSYAEAAILRAAKRIFSHDPSYAPQAANSIEKALDKHVAVDTSAAVTLALLDSEVQDQLIGAFSVLRTTTPTYKDALQGQQSCQLRSTLTIGWNAEEQKLVRNEITEQEADRIARHSDATVAILKRAQHKSWQKFNHLKDLGEGSTWLSTLDYALTNEVAFWCDDLALRSLAVQQGQSTFGTVDLLRFLTDAGNISEQQRDAAESTLISNFHVDLDSEPRIWHLAAKFDGWKASGAAAILTRPSSWKDTAAALDLLAEGINNNHEKSSEAVGFWVNYAAHGVMTIAGEEIGQVSHNLRFLLHFCLVKTMSRPDLFSFVLSGIRQAIEPSQGVSDPLEHVLRDYHNIVNKLFGPTMAKAKLLEVVSHLDDSDRYLASGIILTQPSEHR
ncbi:tetratricopeptide repeat protein [Glutamicibacter sp. 287]|uniref:tetratricopeptide repeat protein n=1 Tax=Glutamicibacter sp. 287 TaxID=3457732 RepID=UPI0040348EAF